MDMQPFRTRNGTTNYMQPSRAANMSTADMQPSSAANKVMSSEGHFRYQYLASRVQQTFPQIFIPEFLTVEK